MIKFKECFILYDIKNSCSREKEKRARMGEFMNLEILFYVLRETQRDALEMSIEK